MFLFLKGLLNFLLLVLPHISKSIFIEKEIGNVYLKNINESGVYGVAAGSK